MWNLLTTYSITNILIFSQYRNKAAQQHNIFRKFWLNCKKELLILWNITDEWRLLTILQDVFQGLFVSHLPCFLEIKACPFLISGRYKGQGFLEVNISQRF